MSRVKCIILILLYMNFNIESAKRKKEGSIEKGSNLKGFYRSKMSIYKITSSIPLLKEH
jgi:hypothetical protein